MLLSFRLAERKGFEPLAPCGVTGFQDQLLKPLGHLSLNNNKYNKRNGSCQAEKCVIYWKKKEGERYATTAGTSENCGF